MKPRIAAWKWLCLALILAGLSTLLIGGGAGTSYLGTNTGIGIDTSGCGDGQVLTYSAAAGKLSCATSPSSAALPSGMIAFIDAGSCPAGFTEDSSFASAYVLGTVAANGDAGTKGGSNSYTPAGTNSAPTFTGTAQTFTAKGSSTGSNQDFTGPNPYTPAGAVSAPAFTGAAAVIQPSFIKVIACKKN